MKKIIMYATSDNGDGHVMEIGRFESLEEVSIFIGIIFSEISFNCSRFL